MADVVLRTEGLSKRYPGGVQALRDLNLTVRRGELFGFLGPNGSGKTTTVSMVLGLVVPTAGRIELLGQPLVHKAVPPEDKRRAQVLRRVGAVVEGAPHVPFLSGRDNLCVAARELGGVPRGRVDALLDLVGLEKQASRKAKTYSLGMKQRLALAMALLNKPEMLFLDEPTNGLDPAGQQEIRLLMTRLIGEGATIFLCSHLLHEVEQVCTRVGVLKEGRMIAEGKVADLLRRTSRLRLRLPEADSGAKVLTQIHG